MDAPSIDARIARIARANLGLVPLRLAGPIGVTAAHLQHRVRTGAVERRARSVYAMAGTEPAWEQSLLASLFVVGPDAVVAGRAAACLLGFDGFDPGPVEVSVRRGRRVRERIGVVHEVRSLPRLDRTTVGRFPVTSGARTIIDLAAVAADDELVAAIGSALRDGLTSEAFLRRRFGVLGGRGRRGTRALRRVLDGPFGHSDLERAFLRLVREAGLPRPRTQVVFGADQVARVDAYWDDEGVVVEVLGHRWHSSRRDLQRDAQRRNELQEIGLVVLEFTSDDVVRRPAAVIGRLRRNLARRAGPSGDTWRARGEESVARMDGRRATLGA